MFMVFFYLGINFLYFLDILLKVNFSVLILFQTSMQQLWEVFRSSAGPSPPLYLSSVPVWLAVSYAVCVHMGDHFSAS